MSDIYCGHCGEPWDSYSAHKHLTECDCIAAGWWHCGECRGTGTRDYRETQKGESHGSIYVGEIEGRECGECGGDYDRPCSACEGSGESDPDKGIECAECRGFGKIVCEHCDCGSNPETCGDCDDELTGSYYEASCFVADGELLCISCAERRGYVTDDCAACDGTGRENCAECIGSGHPAGKRPEETDIGTWEEIDSFMAGKGCPSCDWGSKPAPKIDSYPGRVAMLAKLARTLSQNAEDLASDCESIPGLAE